MSNTFEIDGKTFENPLENTPLTEEERVIFQKITAEITSNTTGSYNPTLPENTIIRFVRGFLSTKPQYETIIKHITSHIESRQSNQLDLILNTEPPKLKEYNEIFKEIVHKQDKQGHL